MDKESYKEQLDEYYDSFQEEFIDIANELEDDYRENVADKDRKNYTLFKKDKFSYMFVLQEGIALSIDVASPQKPAQLMVYSERTIRSLNIENYFGTDIKNNKTFAYITRDKVLGLLHQFALNATISNLEKIEKSTVSQRMSGLITLFIILLQKKDIHAYDNVICDSLLWLIDIHETHIEITNKKTNKEPTEHYMNSNSNVIFPTNNSWYEEQRLKKEEEVKYIKENIHKLKNQLITELLC